MKTKWIVLVVVLAASAVFAASPAFDLWKDRGKLYFSQRHPEEYNELIAELEQGVKDLTAERDALLKSQESTTFVSVAALRATGYELERLEKPSKPDNSDLICIIQTGIICHEQFAEWVAKAREWDHQKKLKRQFEEAITPEPEPKKEELYEAKR